MNLKFWQRPAPPQVGLLQQILSNQQTIMATQAEQVNILKGILGTQTNIAVAVAALKNQQVPDASPDLVKAVSDVNDSTNALATSVGVTPTVIS